MTGIGPETEPLPIVRAHFLYRSRNWTCFRGCHLYRFPFPVSLLISARGGTGAARRHLPEDIVSKFVNAMQSTSTRTQHGLPKSGRPGVSRRQ
jgi:hypothetical protein